MKIGMLVVWLSLIIYVLTIFKEKIVSRNERKWVYIWVGLAFVLSLFDLFHIRISVVTTFINVTFEGISRLVVKL